jgi:hypothetical protein
MSSIFSDPPFRRGSTLAGGDFTYGGATSGADIIGGEIVGQIKAFQDVVPTTGLRLSNRLVYCMAVRWKGSDTADASTVAGLAYALDLTYENNKPLCTITSAATNTNVAAGRVWGVVDEYLTGNLKQNDVLWLVVKGPTAIEANASGATITSGAGLELTGSAGKAQSFSAGTNIGLFLGTSPATKTSPVDASANYTTVTADTTIPALRVSLVSNIH